MEILNCTKHNATHSICKHIYVLKECIINRGSLPEETVITTEDLSINFPRTDWTVPVIISIIISSCIMLLLAGNMVIKIYRYNKISRNEQRI